MKTISQVSDLTGLTHRAIRFYEARGLVAPRKERRGRIEVRVYDEAAIDRLKEVSRLAAYGFSLAQIKAGIDQRAKVQRYADLVMEANEKIAMAEMLKQEIDRGAR